ncbi:hypothetical protein AAMO2058_000057000 [Amorphochlora amoebiformis]|uniref:Uncharacterized protein n=1 Tax=Amorphochlora amoebiformis TaxID=1561963 RepID=A0A7S0GUC9_9EUKA|mmetsp:Transcript_21034/g.33247  ORF Transcript_21034/g.33247 Transcript_21034/m.33247 type:complete len:146 (+) Transcript_21034:55-492(+)
MLDAIPDPHTLSLSQYEKFQAASIIVMCIGLFLAAFRRATRGESMPKDMRVSRCEREEPRKVRFRSKAAEIRYDCRGKVRNNTVKVRWSNHPKRATKFWIRRNRYVDGLAEHKRKSTVEKTHRRRLNSYTPGSVTVRRKRRKPTL